MHDLAVGALCGLLTLALGCHKAEPARRLEAPSKVEVEDRAMGTHLVLAAYTSGALDEKAVRGKLGLAVAEIHRLEGLMTTAG